MGTSLCEKIRWSLLKTIWFGFGFCSRLLAPLQSVDGMTDDDAQKTLAKTTFWGV